MPSCSAKVHYFLVESGGIWGHNWGHIQLNSGRCPQMALSNTAINNAKPKDKGYRLYDEKTAESVVAGEASPVVIEIIEPSTGGGKAK